MFPLYSCIIRLRLCHAVIKIYTLLALSMLFSPIALVALGMAWGNIAVLASGIRAYIPPGIHEGGSYVAAAPEHVLVVAPKHRPYRCCLQLMLYISVNACHITRSS